MPIANISEVWIARTYTPSVIHVFFGDCTVKLAMHRCYHSLISWRATFHYCRMCWLVKKYLLSKFTRLLQISCANNIQLNVSTSLTYSRSNHSEYNKSVSHKICILLWQTAASRTNVTATGSCLSDVIVTRNLMRLWGRQNFGIWQSWCSVSQSASSQ